MIEFLWDEDKGESNFAKHGVSFKEAVTVFADPLSVTIPDLLHSTGEERFVIVGESARARIIVVVHVYRGSGIRIISARTATRKERKIYEEK